MVHGCSVPKVEKVIWWVVVYQLSEIIRQSVNVCCRKYMNFLFMALVKIFRVNYLNTPEFLSNFQSPFVLMFRLLL